MIVRDSFLEAVALGYSAEGLSNEATTTWVVPHSVFYNDESDLSPVTENIDKVIAGLTTWKPKVTKTGVTFPGANIKVQGKDPLEALDNMNNLFLQKMWTDGLPLVPPTPEKVEWIMTGTDLAPDFVLPGDGVIQNLGGIAAVKSLATMLAMAGGRPEYFPVLLAIVEAMTQPEWTLSQMTSTTRSCIPAFVVNGTIGNQIRLNSGYGCLGPDPRHPANVAIGRAIRLVMNVLGGAHPGIGSMSNFGGQRTSNIVIAEDELGVPEDWTTYGEDRGFKRGENVVTGQSVANWYCENLSQTGGGDAVTGSLLATIPWLNARYEDSSLSQDDPKFKDVKWRTDADRTVGFILYPDGFAKLASAAGWSKQKVKEFLFEGQKKTTGFGNALYSEGICYTWDAPYALNTSQINIVVCGGEQAQHQYILNHSNRTDKIVSRRIALPKNWDVLLAQAEKDLGPNPGHTG